MAADDRGPFAQRLRRLREQASLSQEELAERAGLTAKAVGALERGERRRPYPNTVRALADALGLEEPERAALADAARGEQVVDRASSATTREATIPVAPSPTIGRDDVRREVGALLRDGPVRLVTLTGPGGVGKTRVAWGIAADLRRAGVSVVPVELAPVRSADLVVPTIARALGVRAAADDVLDVVATVIGDDRRVLVLDNLEHLLDAAPDVADVLARCPELRVLATSRAPLRIRAEHERPVLPLALPDDDGVQAVLASPSGRLFVDRATAVAPDLELDGRSSAAIATLCRRLDGLPLAIELVAAHARYVSPDQLLDRLDRALGAATMRDLPARQQTMAATLQWSLDLCTEDERRLLEVLSVFAGTFDLPAVEAVAAGTVVDPPSAMDGLVEQSLVVRLDAGPDGDARHRLLEPVRGAVASRLAGSAADGLRARHAEHLASVAAAAGAELRGPDQARWLDQLADQHADLAAALDSLVDRGELGTAAGVAADLWLYWALRGHAAAGLRWVGPMVGTPRTGSLDPPQQVAALVASSGLRLATGDTSLALAHAEEAVALARGADADVRLGEALVLLASAATFEGALDRAAAAVEDLDPLAERTADGWAQAHACTARSQLAIVRGELDEARAALADAEELARRHGGGFTVATVLNVGATLAMLDEDDDVVLDRLAEATTIAAAVGTTWTLVYTLPALAGLAVRRGDAELATTLFSAGASTVERSMVTVTFGPDAEAAAAQLELVRQRLDPAEFERAWDRGHELDPDDVVALLDRLSGPQRPSRTDLT